MKGVAISLILMVIASLPVVAQEGGKPGYPSWQKKAREEYMQKRAGMQNTAESHIEIGKLLRGKGLEGSAQAEFAKALKIDQANKEARRLAGYKPSGKNWVRDYSLLAQKIVVQIDPSLKGKQGYDQLSSFLDKKKNLEEVLKTIDERTGLYRTGEVYMIEIRILPRAGGRGQTWPISIMDENNPAPPFRNVIELDGSSLLGDINSGDTNTFRKTFVHEMTHALQGEVQGFLEEWVAEGLASYTADDNIQAYRSYRGFFTALAKKYGAEKLKQWTQALSDDWIEMCLIDNRPYEGAFKHVFGKESKALMEELKVQ